MVSWSPYGITIHLIMFVLKLYAGYCPVACSYLLNALNFLILVCCTHHWLNKICPLRNVLQFGQKVKDTHILACERRSFLRRPSFTHSWFHHLFTNKLVYLWTEQVLLEHSTAFPWMFQSWAETSNMLLFFLNVFTLLYWCELNKLSCSVVYTTFLATGLWIFKQYVVCTLNMKPTAASIQEQIDGNKPFSLVVVYMLS